MNPVDINYLAVLVCGILSMIVGATWYGPVFGKAWMKEVGYTEDELKKDFNPGKIYGLAVVSHVFMALVLAYLISLTNASTIMEGVRISLSAWFGFIFLTKFINSLFARQTLKLVAIDSGYQLINMLLFGIILILWR